MLDDYADIGSRPISTSKNTHNEQKSRPYLPEGIEEEGEGDAGTNHLNNEALFGWDDR